MSIFGSLFSRQKADAMPIRETLFGDLPLDNWPRGGQMTDARPWGAFVSARLHLQANKESEAIVLRRQILEQPGLEPRHYLQAWHFLRQHGERASSDVAKQVLGIVVEVALPQGLDLLAAYSDHSARYYNYSGAGVVWDHPDSSLDASIDQLLTVAKEVVAKIGPWEQPRPAAPPKGQVRMSFLTPSGLHVGQGPMNALAADPFGGRVIQLATMLMRELIAKTQPS
jgi:hypothetical protein